MRERRFGIRKFSNAKVRLYHPTLGRLDGATKDISNGGIAVLLDDITLPLEDREITLFLRPVNLDVLFSVICLRQSESTLVFKFVE